MAGQGLTGEPLILSYGFERRRVCHCGGFYTEVYTKGEYELSWRRKRYLVKLKKSGTTLFGWVPVDELAQEIIKTKSEAVLN